MGKTYVVAGEVAEAIGGVVWGDPQKRIYGIALPKDSDSNMLTYFEKNASLAQNERTEFAACIVPMKYKHCDERTYIVVNNDIYKILHKVVGFLIEKGIYSIEKRMDSIGRHTYISPSAQIGDGCVIGNNVSIEDNVTIGNNCTICSNVVIEHGVVIGNNVVIQSGAIIGSDSFEYAEDEGYQKIHNLGTVVIKDSVVIGANTTIARGTIGNTIIGEGTIIDNLVQIGHEVEIGTSCRICSQCGLSGWSKLEDDVVLYGKVGVSNWVVIEKNATVLGMSGASKRVKSNTVVSGIPAKENSVYLKEKALVNRLIKKGDII